MDTSYTFATASAADLKAFAGVTPLQWDNVLHAASNPHWDWYSFRDVFVGEGSEKDRKEIARTFIDNLNEVSAKAVLPRFAKTIDPSRKNARDALIYVLAVPAFSSLVERQWLVARLRELYELDDEIPDSWVIQAVS